MFLSKNHVQHSKDKHIEIRIHFIRDCLEKKLIELMQVPTNLQLADLFTKSTCLVAMSQADDGFSSNS